MFVPMSVRSIGIPIPGPAPGPVPATRRLVTARSSVAAFFQFPRATATWTTRAAAAVSPSLGMLCVFASAWRRTGRFRPPVTKNKNLQLFHIKAKLTFLKIHTNSSNKNFKIQTKNYRLRVSGSA